MYRCVELGGMIDGSDLLRILDDAAKDCGLRIKAEDEYREEYDLARGPEPQRVYEKTNVRVVGRVLPLINVNGVKKGSRRSGFVVTTGMDCIPPKFLGSESTVNKYLGAVYERLKLERGRESRPVAEPFFEAKGSLE